MPRRNGFPVVHRVVSDVVSGDWLAGYNEAIIS